MHRGVRHDFGFPANLAIAFYVQTYDKRGIAALL